MCFSKNKTRCICQHTLELHRKETPRTFQRIRYSRPKLLVQHLSLLEWKQQVWLMPVSSPLSSGSPAILQREVILFARQVLYIERCTNGKCAAWWTFKKWTHHETATHYHRKRNIGGTPDNLCALSHDPLPGKLHTILTSIEIVYCLLQPSLNFM